MSRLDYITVGIVALCILAIVFLVYKMTDLFSGNKDAEKTEIAADSVEVDDGTLDYNIKEDVDSAGAAADKSGNGGSSAPASKPSTKPSTPAATEKEQEATTSAAEDDAEAKTDNAPATSAGGNFLVIAGSFKQKAGAQQEVKRLKKLGYDNATMTLFNRSSIAAVLVDRFDNMADAEKLVKDLKEDKVAAYVKRKE